MNSDQFRKFIEAVELESRSRSLDDGPSYAYMVGVLQSLLESAVGESERMREVTIAIMKEYAGE